MVLKISADKQLETIGPISNKQLFEKSVSNVLFSNKIGQNYMCHPLDSRITKINNNCILVKLFQKKPK